MTSRTWSARLTGLLSLAATAVLLVGVPAALVRLVGNPLPDRLPDWQAVWTSIQAGALTTAVVVDVLAVVVWFAWAQLALGLLVEAVALVRDSPAARLPITPGFQLAAGRLVAGIALLLSSFGGPTRLAAATPLEPLDPPAAVGLVDEQVDRRVDAEVGPQEAHVDHPDVHGPPRRQSLGHRDAAAG